MKHIFLASAVLVTLAFASSCKKNLEACVTLDKTAYLVSDTIFADASCSEHADTYLWAPQAGLQMLGNGSGVSERFLVLSLPGSLSRTIDLTVSNKKSTRNTSKSAVVL
jgi:hypothetical protein